MYKMKTKWYTRLLAFLVVFLGAAFMIPAYIIAAVTLPFEYVFFGRSYPFLAELYERLPSIVRNRSRSNQFCAAVSQLTGWELID